MRAITICQPYAALICLPDDHDRAKRVENRTWPTQCRGPLLIHAGKSREWLELSEDGLRDEEYDLPLADMPFGAIVAVCNLVGCFNPHVDAVGSYAAEREAAYRRWAWLRGHEHVEGPFCFVLTEVRKFAEPIEYRGRQGFFDVPLEVVKGQL